MLNLARAVQGTGGAMMFATSLALIAQAFHGKERGTAFGVFGARHRGGGGGRPGASAASSRRASAGNGSSS